MAEQSRQAAKGSTPARRSETAAERADRNMGELLQELRVALPGVQVLFAFLLTVPFAQGFVTLTEGQRDLYFAVLMCDGDRDGFADRAHRRCTGCSSSSATRSTSSRSPTSSTIAGLGVLAISITGAVLLIADILFDGIKVVIYPGFIGLLLLGLWGLLPLLRRAQLEDAER